MNVLVFDIGGTNLRCALYDTTTGEVRLKVVEPTPNQWSSSGTDAYQIQAEIIDAIQTIGEQVRSGSHLSAISIAFPGPVSHNGAILAAPAVWGKNPDGPFDLKVKLSKFWPTIPVFVANDITAAGYRYLNEKDQSFCLVTVSTGIGSKVFINGKPQLGSSGAGGEIGHLRVLFDHDAPVCDCGETGHLQAISSGRGVLNFVKRKAMDQPCYFRESFLWKRCVEPNDITNEDICDAFHSKDNFTCEAIVQCTRPLAGVLATLQISLELEKFLIVGGFAFALGNDYLQILSELAQEACWQYSKNWKELLQFGYNDDHSGLIGAGNLAKFHLECA